MKKLLLITLVLGLLSTPVFAQSWGRGGGYVGADRNQGYYPSKGVHRYSWSISGGCAAWRARGGTPAPGRVAGQRAIH